MHRLNMALMTATAVAAAAFYALASPGNDHHGPTASAPVPAQPAGAPSAAATAAQAQANASQALISPFGRAAPPPPPSLAERARERRVRMRAMGIDTADHYYSMPVAELKQRAARKDVLAMLQLAVQYGSESEHLVKDEDGVDPRTEQKKCFAAALNAGHIRSASLLAQLHWQENKPVEAYAWQLLAKRLGDTDSASWGSDAFAGLSHAARLAAEKKAEELYRQANRRFAGPA